VFNIEQEKEEHPSEFLARLKGKMRKYSGLDSEDLPPGPGTLIGTFCYKQLSNISKKLQT
jgi:hypothetical protein